MLVSISVTGLLSACGEDDVPDHDQVTHSIIGKWICHNNANGAAWPQPLIYMFADDGFGYEWFQDVPYSQRLVFRYAVSGNCILLDDGDKYDSLKLTYEISKNGNQLILYGFDNDEMRELHFVREITQ